MYQFVFSFVGFAVMGMEAKAFCMLGKCSTTELPLPPHFTFSRLTRTFCITFSQKNNYDFFKKIVVVDGQHALILFV